VKPRATCLEEIEEEAMTNRVEFYPVLQNSHLPISGAVVKLAPGTRIGFLSKFFRPVGYREVPERETISRYRDGPKIREAFDRMRSRIICPFMTCKAMDDLYGETKEYGYLTYQRIGEEYDRHVYRLEGGNYQSNQFFYNVELIDDWSHIEAEQICLVPIHPSPPEKGKAKEQADEGIIIPQAPAQLRIKRLLVFWSHPVGWLRSNQEPSIEDSPPRPRYPRRLYKFSGDEPPP
jgi:hypothetical protein